MFGHSVNSALKIWLGAGKTYCGTLNIFSASSMPPMMTTAPRRMTSASSLVRASHPEIEKLEARPPSADTADACFRLNL